MDDLQEMPSDWQRALAVVAHPDDLEYGAASAVARWTGEGKEVAYVLASRGEAGIDGMDPATAGPVRAAEEEASAAVVGVSVVEFLDHPDGAIEHGLRLRRDIARAIRRHRPELLITLNHREAWSTAPGSTPNMADHRNVGLAAIDAARDAGNRWVFTELTASGLEPWPGVRWVAVAGSPVPTHAVEVTETLHLGVRSLQEHRAYLEGLSQPTDPEPFLRGAAEATAERFGGRLSVAFELLPL